CAVLPPGKEESMIELDREQWDRLEDLASEDLIDKVQTEAKQRYPDKLDGQAPGTVRQRLRCSLRRAWAHRLSPHEHLMAFGLLSVCVGPSFDLYPRFKQILTQSDVPGSMKLGVLMESAGRFDWDLASRFEPEAAEPDWSA